MFPQDTTALTRRNRMNKAAIYAIERILSRGDRAEVIPGPDSSVKVIRIRREVAYQPENFDKHKNMGKSG